MTRTEARVVQLLAEVRRDWSQVERHFERAAGHDELDPTELSKVRAELDAATLATRPQIEALCAALSADAP